MRRSLPRTVAPLLMGIALAAGAAGCAGPTAPTSADTGSARALVTEAGRNWDADFNALASPADAVSHADLIITGTVVGVSEGITIEYRDGQTIRRDIDSYATFEVRVDRVLSDRTGTPTAADRTGVPAAAERAGVPAAADRAGVPAGAERAGSVIYVAVNKGISVTTEELARLNPKARTVLVLEDRTDRARSSTVKVIRPATIPAAAPVFMPYTDGMWLQGPADRQMYGVNTGWEDLLPGWGSAKTVDQFADRITAAVATH